MDSSTFKEQAQGSISRAVGQVGPGLISCITAGIRILADVGHTTFSVSASASSGRVRVQVRSSSGDLGGEPIISASAPCPVFCPPDFGDVIRNHIHSWLKQKGYQTRLGDDVIHVSVS